MVGEVRINEIVASIVADIRDDERQGGWTFRDLPLLRTAETTTGAAALGFAMQWMNQSSVNARYKECKAEPYQYRHTTPISGAGFVKALQGFLYQCGDREQFMCAKGNVDQSALYLEITTYINSLSRLIVQALPEYENTDWV